MTLLEAYADNVKLAEAVYRKKHNDAMSVNMKTTVAKVLDNTDKFLKESIGGASATQRSDLGTNRRFAFR